MKKGTCFMPILISVGCTVKEILHEERDMFHA